MGHPIHSMLIVFPLGLFATAVVFDIVYLTTDRQGMQVAAAYMIGAGVVGGLLAAVFGFIDWLALPAGTRAKRIGAMHGRGNVLVVVLFAASWVLRARAGGWHSGAVALTLSFVGVAVAVFTGWLGGELVNRHGVGVADDAGLDVSTAAPDRSVSTREATD